MTVNDMLEKIESIDNVIADLEKSIDYEENHRWKNTIEDAIDIINSYKDELLRRKISV